MKLKNCPLICKFDPPLLSTVQVVAVLASSNNSLLTILKNLAL